MNSEGPKSDSYLVRKWPGLSDIGKKLGSIAWLRPKREKARSCFRSAARYDYSKTRNGAINMAKRMNHRDICKEWMAVSRLKNVDHRRGTEAALAQCRRFLATVLAQTEVEQTRYYYVAQQGCDHLWSHNIAHRTAETSGYPGHHGCRVRLRQRKLELSWYYNHFVPKKSGEGCSVFSEYIRKEGRCRYHKSAFARAQDWEKPRILETEDGFEIVRKLNANLMELRRVVRSSERLLNDLEKHLGGLKAPASSDTATLKKESE